MALPTNEYYRVSLNFTGAGVPSGASVVLCVHDSTTSSPTVVATAVLNAVNTCGIMALVAANCDLTSALCKQGPDETGPAAIVSSALGGGAAGAQSAPNTAYLLHKVTALGGRRGRGRAYWPGVPETQVTEAGVLDAGVRTQAASDWNQFITTLDGIGMPLQLEHAPATTWQLVDGQPRRIPTGSAPSPTEVISGDCDSLVATQRRRLRR